MKVKIDCDEWYPVYSIENENSRGRLCEISEELMAESIDTIARFDALQKKTAHPIQ